MTLPLRRKRRITARTFPPQTTRPNHASLPTWTLSVAILGLSSGLGAWAQDGASSRRPARLLVPQDARPLPVQAEVAEERVEIGVQLAPARPLPRPQDEEGMARVQPAVVQLKLLDNDDQDRRPPPTAVGRTWTEIAPRQVAPAISRVSHQDRSWTRRSGSPGEDLRVARGDYRRTETVTSSFDDPFGDRRASPRPMVLAPSRGSYSVQLESEDPLYPPPAARGRTTPRSSPDCDRVYNDRNCCDDDAACQQARQRILRSPISAISLDISPRFNPTSPDTGRLPDRERTFEEETRTWRNRAGERVAQGSLVGIEHGRVLIRLTTGVIERVPLRQLSDDDICYFAAWWGVPNVCTLTDEMYAGRDFTPLTMSWKASALCHKPLYFEEVQLERYGHTTGPLVQPVLSGAHFVLNIAALPYRAGINPPTECQYALGYYRPGSCAPWMVPPIPLSVRGGLAQAGVIVGGVAIIP